MRGQRPFPAKAVLSFVYICFTAGCGNHAVSVVAPEQNKEPALQFLKDGETTRSEVFSRFGEKPARKSEDDDAVIFTMDKDGRITGMPKYEERLVREFENGRILIFALDKKYRVPSSVKKAKFHLILVFDETDGKILKRHSVVRIR